MNHSYIPTVRRMHEKGFPLRDIMHATGLNRSDIQRIIGKLPKRRCTREETRQNAIFELLAEGHAPGLVAAVFGE